MIAVRKDGADALTRKRAPKGHVLTHKRELNETDRYRTPMDDSGHLWEVGTKFFRCGRYIEYPLYYYEGWDAAFGTYWVQIDTRAEKGNICSLCNADRKADVDLVKSYADIERAARKFNVTVHYPAPDVEENDIPEAYTRWIGEKANRLYAGD